MRKLVLQMMTTLNGRLDDPDAWVTGIGDDLYTDIDRLYDTFDTVLVGRVTYEEMHAYWPGAETEEGGPEINRRMARKMNTYRKVVVSKAGEDGPLEWNNAERAVARDDDDLAGLIRDLTAQPGGDIHLAGGARLAQAVIRLGLVDEYRFYVYPVVSGGAAWFDEVEDERGLELSGVTAFEDGVVGLTYRSREPGDAAGAERVAESVS